MIVFLLLLGYTTQAQLTDGPSDGGGGTTKYYRDSDGDGYGNPNSSYVTSSQSGYVANKTDCNDANAVINPTTRWYRDVDGDGRGRTSPIKIQCAMPSGYVLYKDDRDDNNIHITHIAPRNFYRDADGDGYGNPSVKVYRSVRPGGYVTNNSDCNDSNASINPNKTWYRDADGDGWGNKNSTTKKCTQPSGYVSNDDDINDSDKWITNITPRYFYRDVDKDTYGSQAAVDRLYRSLQPSGYVTNNSDCVDNNAAIHPNTIWYKDNDSDGFGTSGTTFKGCNQPLGYVINNTDCNDGNRYIHPNTVWYKDGDGDGFASSKTTRCSSPGAGYTYNVLPVTDCNDNNNKIHPNTKWYKDSDGDGFAASTLVRCSSPGSGYTYTSMPVSDCDDSNASINPNTVWYKNSDGDGFASMTKTQCSSPGSGYSLTVKPLGDCNDSNAAIHPNTVWYKNSDGDGFASMTKTQCSSPGSDYSLTVKPLGDCNDSNAAIHPNTVWYKNSDGDGFASTTKTQCSNPGNGYSLTVKPLGDCNDDDINIHPDTIWYKDSDGDGFAGSTKTQCTSPGSGYIRSVLPVTDCDDTNSGVHPNTKWYADTDNDGLGDPSDTTNACEQPLGYVANSTDLCPDEFGDQQGCKNAPYTLTLSNNENYVYSRTYLKEMTLPSGIKFNKDVAETVTYMDGLGRPKQQTAIKASPTEQDIISHIEYDELGRQAKQYLPFTKAATGAYTAVNVTNHINSYYLNTYANDFPGITNPAQVNAYSESIYEASPLNRILEQGAPGTAWKADPNSDTDHTVKFDWRHNSANEVVRFDVTFTDVSITEEPSLTKRDFYAANELMVSITKDENWKTTSGDNHTTREYKDKQGRIVLKRSYNEGVPHETYYVYDDYGNLTYVLPPKVTTTDGVSTTELAELCYQYRYDYRNRLIEKKIPGKGWEYIVYNKLDQPVMSQDANLKAQGKWLFTKYDAMGRVTYTGIITNNSDRAAIQDSANNTTVYKQYETKQSSSITIAGTTIYYSNDAIPQGITEIHTINYYDDYNFDLHGMDKPATVYQEATTNNVRGLPTGTKIRVLGTNNWITAVTAYDKKGRTIWTGSRNHYLSTIDKTSIKLDFTGRVMETTTSHVKNGSTPLITIDKYEYDHADRVTQQTQKIDNQDEELIASNNYDEVGQLTSKNVGGAIVVGTIGLQTVDYTYNVRGWLKGINNVNTLGNDLFSFAIDYNKGTSPLYNGNISKTSWQTANDNITRSYTYTYDALNRIKTGISNDNKYNLSNVTYDKMGNILSLSRKGHTNTAATTFGDMDILAYTYDSGNKLLKVVDTANDAFGFKDDTNINDDFEYDDNGNMVIDRNKGITGMTYNHLNLPTTVSISNSEGTGTISYIYDATGAKLKKIVTEGSSLTETVYAGNYMYENGQLQFMFTPEGYATPNGSSYRYVYQFKDHLNNIRLSYKDANQDGNITQNEIVQEKNYYPFGLTHKGYNSAVNGRNHNYGFVGKEENDEIGLEWLDFGARNYNVALGRWMNVDALADELIQYDKSPYGYSFNNPIYFIDPDGNSPCPPGIPCENVLPNMERIRVNRASNLGAGFTRSNGQQWHAGHDLYAPAGTSVQSSMAGYVVAEGENTTYGNYVTIKTTHKWSKVVGYNGKEKITETVTDTYYHFYAHLESTSVSKEDTVTAGQEVGKVGTTGNATDYPDDPNNPNVHLHFEIGTELRGPNNPFLRRSTLLDANVGYKNVKFMTQDENGNQSSTGVVKIYRNDDGVLTLEFQDFKNTQENGYTGEKLINNNTRDRLTNGIQF